MPSHLPERLQYNAISTLPCFSKSRLNGNVLISSIVPAAIPSTPTIRRRRQIEPAKRKIHPALALQPHLDQNTHLLLTIKAIILQYMNLLPTRWPSSGSYPGETRRAEHIVLCINVPHKKLFWTSQVRGSTRLVNMDLDSLGSFNLPHMQLFPDGKQELSFVTNTLLQGGTRTHSRTLAHLYICQVALYPQGGSYSRILFDRDV